MKMSNFNLLYDSKQFKSKKFLDLLIQKKEKETLKGITEDTVVNTQKMRLDNGTVQMLNILILATALWW